MTRVMKFGGAALADGAGMARVADIVAGASGPVTVVASAMHGVTDRLQEALDGGATDESRVWPLLEHLRDQHKAALVHVAPDGDDAAEYALRTTLERLERLLYGIAYTQEVTERLRDLVLSFGERLSTAVLAAALRAHGTHAVHVESEDAGLITHGPYGNARPDLDAQREKVPAALEPLMRDGTVPVVTGFYGVDGTGNATLFGRGGSDYVAALVGAALRADAVELWKDVAGFLSADPRAVAHARLVPELGYDEAAELANVGAKVLHPRAVEPVESLGIPIHIRCFSDPGATGSRLTRDVPQAVNMVRSVASRQGLAIVRLNGSGMAYTPGVAKRVFDALSDVGINVLNMSTSQATFALLLREEDAEAARTALEPLVGGVVQSIETLPGRSLVCVVGRGLGERPGSAARILDAVSKAGVNVEMISLGASDIAIDLIIQTRDHDRTLQGVHAEFLNGELAEAA